MYSRNRLDIDWSDLALGIGYGLFARDGRAIERRLTSSWHPGTMAFSTVRAAWDALLAEMALPKGTKVLCTAVNIPDMFQILEHHGLVPVPVDLNPMSMAVEAENWRSVLTDDVGLVLVAHLLGTRNTLDVLFELCEQHGIPVIEDCAQAFDGLGYTGDPRSLATLFSFGPIKTRAALGGCIAIVRHDGLREGLATRVAQYPRQSRRGFLAKVAKYAVMKLLTLRPCYTLFVKICAWRGSSHDQVINGAVLGLKGDDYYKVLRTRPAVPLLAMLRRRIKQERHPGISKREKAGEALLELLPSDVPVLGKQAEHRTWWQFCIVSCDPQGLISHLRACGFDATDGSSRLAPVPAPEGLPDAEVMKSAMANVVYIPAYAQLGHSARLRLAQALGEAAELLADFSPQGMALPDFHSSEAQAS